jgi:anti-sigma B factor antagonist
MTRMGPEPGPAHVDGWIEISELGTTLLLRVIGELDVATRTSIEPALMAAIEAAGPIILDLGGLTFCDSSGLATLIAAHDRAAATGSSFAVRNASAPVRRLFEITNLAETIPVLD